MSFLLLPPYAAAQPTAETPSPQLESAFCASVQQWVESNSSGGAIPPANVTWPPGSTFRLCMDTSQRTWSRRGLVTDAVTHQPMDTWQLFNGTDLFVLSPNAAQAGGYSCQRKVTGPPQEPLPMPWSMVVIDSEATAAGTEAGFDGFATVGLWQNDRPQRGALAPGNMTWRIRAGGGSEPLLLRTSYVHMDPRGVNASGERDFSANYTTTLPASWEPPAAVACTLPADAFVPADDCRPACAADSLCCREPRANATGACFGVSNCAQLPGPAEPSLVDGFSWGGLAWWS